MTTAARPAVSLWAASLSPRHVSVPHRIAIAARPELNANGRPLAARCPLRLRRTRPKRTAWLKGCAALMNFFQGQHVAAGPKAGFEAGRILLWQAGTTHFGGGRHEIVVERAMLDCDPIRLGSQTAEPNPRRPVVRGRPDGPGVMPQLPVDRLSEWQATVAGNDAVKRGLPDLLEFNRCNSGRKNEAIHDVDAPMDHCKSIASDFNVDSLRQIGHPGPRIGVQLARCVGKPCG